MKEKKKKKRLITAKCNLRTVKDAAYIPLKKNPANPIRWDQFLAPCIIHMTLCLGGSKACLQIIVPWSFSSSSHALLLLLLFLLLSLLILISIFYFIPYHWQWSVMIMKHISFVLSRREHPAPAVRICNLYRFVESFPWLFSSTVGSDYWFLIVWLRRTRF